VVIHLDDWPPPYEYLGRPTAWVRVIHDFGEPVRHRHACPDCYDHWECTERCTLEPDLEADDGTPHGSHYLCAECEHRSEILERGILAGEPRTDEPFVDDLQLELDLGA
jgi:hypothetical protein